MSSALEPEANRPGLPRPRAVAPDGVARPVPWSQGEVWGRASHSRIVRCEEESLCLVCGEYAGEGMAYVAPGDWSGRTPLHRPDLASVVDGGPLHERCEKIARAHCRELREMLKKGQVVVAPYRDLGPDVPLRG